MSAEQPQSQRRSSERSRPASSQAAGRPWLGWLGLAALIGLPVLSLLTFWVWTQNQSGDADVVVETGMSHVHGLGTNPADGATFVATHSGVFRFDGDARPERVADRYQDTMGFTITGPDRFLASGHPDMTDSSLPTHLGLIESTDAAVTWREVSLGGKADLHALDGGPGQVVAFDSISGQLMTSADGKVWDAVATAPVLDVAIDPSRTGSFLATSTTGQITAYDARGTGRVVPGPAVGYIDWPASDLLVAAGPDGQLHRSVDGGASWDPVGQPLGVPQAIDISEAAWLVATEDRVVRSTDAGESWETLVEFAG